MHEISTRSMRKGGSQVGIPSEKRRGLAGEGEGLHTRAYRMHFIFYFLFLILQYMQHLEQCCPSTMCPITQLTQD